MATFDNSYSRLVAWLKILLPLVALAILSTIFLVSRTINPLQTLPYSKVDIDEIAQDQRVGNPNYSGVTQSGAAVTLSAESIRPNLSDQNIIFAKLLKGKIETTNGTIINLFSKDGTFDSDLETVDLTGSVLLTTSSGYDLHTDHLNGHLDASELNTNGPVQMNGPSGHIEAGKMSLTLEHAGKDQEGYVLVFTEGVKVVYNPSN